MLRSGGLLSNDMGTVSLREWAMAAVSLHPRRNPSSLRPGSRRGGMRRIGSFKELYDDFCFNALVKSKKLTITAFAAWPFRNKRSSDGGALESVGYLVKIDQRSPDPLNYATLAL